MYHGRGMRRICMLAVLVWCQAARIQGERQLRLLQEVCRHGDRTPLGTYPADINAQYWTEGMAQLTKKGMKQHFDLGSYLRERYIHNMSFISPQYKAAEVYVRSTDKDRTLVSAYSQLSGLFPPPEGQRFESDIKWQPIPVHTVDKANDILLYPDHACPRADVLYEQFMASPHMQEYTQQRQSFYEFLAEKTGNNDPVPFTEIVVFDVTYCERAHGLSSPEWVTDAVWKQVDDGVMDFFHNLYTDGIQGKLRGGPLVREMRWNMERAMNGTMPERKINIYSGHDTTVGSFLAALGPGEGLYNHVLPPYAAAVLVELWQDDVTRQYSVRILYKNDTLPTPLVLEGCEEYCPWPTFKHLTLAHVSEDYHAECDVETQSQTHPPVPASFQQCSKAALIVNLVIILVLLFALATVIVICRRQRSKAYPVQPSDVKAEMYPTKLLDVKPSSNAF